MTKATQPNTLGIDFGTSNSAAGILLNGRPHLIEIEPGLNTIPTSVFFDFATREMQIGSVANRALIEGREGRYMRGLKSILGTSLMRERRQMLGEPITFMDIVARFLARVKARAESACHQPFNHAVSGRPVHFHSGDPGRDAQALADLSECYAMAGFTSVRFLFEPEAAAIANGSLAAGIDIGLIVDIGGGTSDFSLFASDASAAHGIRIIASNGVRVGGTNFDKSISFEHVMPLFGRGADIRKDMGPGLLTAPNAIYEELASWEKIPFLYTPETRRGVHDLRRLAVTPQLFDRLAEVLAHELGHEVAFAVERGKIAANKAGDAGARIDLRMVESQLSAGLSSNDMATSLARHAAQIHDCALETLALAGLQAGQVTRVIFVGGSSLMAVVEATMRGIFPDATLAYRDAFTGVVDGLAIASGTA